MKQSPILLAALLAVAAPLNLSAAVAYWDGNDILTGAGESPSGTWGSSLFWSTDPNGESSTGAWTAGDTSVFSAGTDAVGAYTVTLTGTSSSPGTTAAAIIVEEGVVTFSGGTVGLGAGSVTINAGGVLNTNSSLRVSTTAGSIYTLDGGTLRTTNTGANGSFIDGDSAIVLGAGGGTFAYDVTNTLNIIQNASISGPGSFTKIGPGILAVASAGTYAGTTTINDGELRIRTSANRLPTTTAVTVNNPGILNLNRVNQQIGSLTGDGSVGLGDATLTVGDSTSTTFGGSIRDIANAGTGATTALGGKVTKIGNGTLTLASVNTYTGAFTLSAGTVTVDLDGTLSGPTANAVVNAGVLNLNNSSQAIQNLSGSGGTINLGSGHTLTISPIASSTYAGAIAGSGGIIKVGASMEIFSGTNSYGGGTTISAGTLSVNADAALGAAVGGVTIDSGATLQAGGTVVSNRSFVLGTGGAQIDTNGNSVTLTADSSVAGTTLTKIGTGTLTLSGTQAYAQLDTEGGVTALNTALGTGASTVIANAATNFNVSQKLASLTIGPAGVVTLTASAPGALPEFGGLPDGAAFGVEDSAPGAAAAGPVQAVPEPGALSLLAAGVLGMLGRRRRAS